MLTRRADTSEAAVFSALVPIMAVGVARARGPRRSDLSGRGR
jgi:hypothetical protein